MKVAIVHYWLVNMRGGEKVVEALCELFPDADVFTHVYKPSGISPTIRNHEVQTTFIQKLPFSRRWYQKYLPLMPLALEQLDLRGYDLVISSESGPAKGVIVSSDTLHICYCHTPMRYVWNMYHYYLKNTGLITRIIMRPVIHYLRIWDFVSAARVDHFIANSGHVAKRIAKHYRREAEIIPPPVDVDAFSPSTEQDDYYLFLGQLVPYKRADLAVEAFNSSGRNLVIIGEGEQLSQLRKMSKSNVKIIGWQPVEVIRDYYSHCKALIFPGEEDFGIVPVEAMASGRPVIAYAKGGALETVVDGVTGLFFDEQTPASLVNAIERYEHMQNDFFPNQIIQHARQFDRKQFKKRILETINELMRNK